MRGLRRYWRRFNSKCREGHWILNGILWGRLMAIRLERYLALNKYFLNLFGFSSFDELREKLKDVEEGYDATGRSYFVDALIGLKPEWEEDLLRYDLEIREYVKKLRKNRRQPNFNLKYFQYLAVLFTEIFLDKYYKDRAAFLAELNSFLRRFNEESGIKLSPFTEEDLKKIAFWMATGSGKTLIMHINYWQIMKYSKGGWDNVILITPNEGLSKQHYEEFKLSGIPCKLYEGNVDDLKTREGEVLIIDIYKLTEEKKGEGVRVDVSYFDGKNLVFIDEGHKGQKSEEQKWKRLREEIGKRGFLFEYSATFGQVIGKNKDLLEEYAKAIIFDYSYKYFYTDGYGKDFYVYNIRSGKGGEGLYSEEQQDLLLTAGLLSFYEQLLLFDKYEKEMREYKIEKPLWIFVGSKVTGKGINSDVVRVIHFLNKVTKDEEYLKETVAKILAGKSGLVDEKGKDVFKGKFKFLRELSVDSLVEDLYQRVFGGRGELKLYEIKNAEGEIGLKVSTAKGYFGVINVGNVSDLLFYFRPEKIREKLEKAEKRGKGGVEELRRALKYIEENGNLIPEEDLFSQSLFFRINDSDSPINVLIGSKKFVEGWNSWRVSNMCLINMGKGEGPQIIQLFGRGVRLKGKNYSLKREANPDSPLKVLQTLFIFGLNADYINAFLTAIEQEGVDYEEISIPIKFNRPERWEGKIYTLKTGESFDFLECPVKLEIDEDVLKEVKIDLRPKITLAHGLNVGEVNSAFKEAIDIPESYLKTIDWDSIYLEILNYKASQGMFNLLVNKETLREIVERRKYKIFLQESSALKIERVGGRPTLRIASWEGFERLHDLILMVLKSYIQKFYRREERRRAMEFLEAKPLFKERFPNMFPENCEIVIKIPKKLTEEISKVSKQLKEYEEGKIPEEWRNWSSFIVHLDRHLYTPLIVWREGREEVKSFPVKLNRGEAKFVKDFQDFLTKNAKLLENKEVFLLRNLSRRGVGFFLSSGFYPDFIIWAREGERQHMIFIDPKGIRNLGNFNDDKIRLCSSYIKEVEKRVNEKLRGRGDRVNLILDAFIISVSSYYDVKNTFGEGNYSKEEFERHNVLFQEDPKYVKKIFEKAGIL